MVNKVYDAESKFKILISQTNIQYIFLLRENEILFSSHIFIVNQPRIYNIDIFLDWESLGKNNTKLHIQGWDFITQILVSTKGDLVVLKLSW